MKWEWVRVDRGRQKVSAATEEPRDGGLEQGSGRDEGSEWIWEIFRTDTVERTKGCEGWPLASSLQKQMDGGFRHQEGGPWKETRAREQRPRGCNHIRQCPSMGAAQPCAAVLLRREEKTVELIFWVISGQVLQHLIYMSLVSKLILKPSYNLTRFTYTDIITPKLFLI